MSQPLDYAAPLNAKPSSRLAWLSVCLALLPILLAILAVLAETETPSGMIVDPPWARPILIIMRSSPCLGLALGMVAVKRGTKAPAVAGIAANALMLGAMLFT